jgi:putative ATPase
MSKLISEVLRPTSFNDLVISEKIKDRLQTMLDKGNILNMIFYGKPGTGKTSAAKIFIENENYETLIINGSLETSVDEIRSRVRGFTTSCSLFGKMKIVFIDEADYLSKSSQAGLRKVIEDSSENCRFIFTANEIHKIHPALISRLLSISFDMTSSQIEKALESYKSRVLKIMEGKYEEIDSNRIVKIINNYYPDYRKIANYLEFEFI